MAKRSPKPKEPPPMKRPGTAKDHDFVTVARNVVEQAIGENMDGSPLAKAYRHGATTPRNPGAAKGGAARAKALSAAARRSIAKGAAETRWRLKPKP